ncbi:MAG: hypothetical protein HOC23_23140 [Halieaceae bacterium]|jgi:hypothetical protein|nr:hypothetical protein [Halieaceae bacterium]
MNSTENHFSLDWRVAFGLVVTTAWFTAGLTYLLGIVGWANFIHLPTADIGSFLEGAFAPLAFLWLVIGHFMQQKEISANTKAIHIQERSAQRLEMHAHRDTYFKLLALIQDQLGSISAFHYMSVAGPSGTGQMTSEEFAEGRANCSNGDHAFFVRKMTGMSYDLREDVDALQNVYFGTEIRKRHTENYLKTFEKLLKAAREVDADDMISNALHMGSAIGRQYRIIKYVQGEDAYELELLV